MIAHSVWPRRILAVAGALGATMVSASMALAASNYTLMISGSTTVFPSAQAVFTNVYATSPVGSDVAVDNPGVKAGETHGQVGNSGSGVGYQELFCGAIDIGDGSRPPQAGDIAPASPAAGQPDCTQYGLTNPAPLGLSDIDSWVVAKDGISAIINSPSLGGSPIPGTGLQVNDLAKIYACKALKWSDINAAWPSTTIVAFSREVTSGTYGDFLAFIGVSKSAEQACFGNSTVNPPIQAFDTNHIRATGNPGMQSAVQNNANSVAYVGLGFTQASNLTVVPVGGSFSGTAGDSTQAGYSTGTVVTPTVSSIDAQVAAQNGGAACSPGGCYPFGRQLFMNTVKESSLGKVPAARTTNYAKAIAFVNAATSQAGQQQFVNEGEAGLTTQPGTTDTLHNSVTAKPAVQITPQGGLGATQNVNPQVIPGADVTMDGNINITDVVSVGSQWQASGPNGTKGWIRQDVNVDGFVNITDVVQIGSQWQVAWQRWVL